MKKLIAGVLGAACWILVSQASALDPLPDTPIVEAGSEAFILDINNYIDGNTGMPFPNVSPDEPRRNAVKNTPEFRDTWMRRDYEVAADGTPAPYVDFLDGHSAAFTKGNLPVGYGEINAFTNGNWSTEGFATDLGDRPGDHFGLYIRVPFTTTGLNTNVVMEFAGDDAFMFYLDDELIANVGACCQDGANGEPTVGTPYHFDYTVGNVANDENEPMRMVLGNGVLTGGDHLLSVSVHQGSATSSDTGFDFRLVGPGNAREWNVNQHADWNDDANWDLDDAANTDEYAIFGDVNTGNRTIWNDRNTSLDGIRFEDANAYNLAGTGTLTLDGAGARNATLSATLGDHQLQMRVELGSNAESDIAAGSSITLNNRFLLNNRTLDVAGGGGLVIRNTANTGDGTINVSDGYVAGNGTVAGDINATATGSINPGAESAIATTLKVTGDATGNATFALFGPGESDVLDGGGSGNVDLSLITIELAGGYTPANGDQFQLLQNWNSVSAPASIPVGNLSGTIDENGLLTIGDVPPPVGECDFDANGTCNIEDIDILIEAIVNGTDAGDMNDDGVTDLEDRTAWLAAAGEQDGLSGPYLVGDATLDGEVQAMDLNVVGISWLKPETTKWSEGNFDGILGTQAQDLNEVGINWNRSVPPAASAVPEPSAFSLLSLAGLLLLRYRRK